MLGVRCALAMREMLRAVEGVSACEGWGADRPKRSHQSTKGV